MKRLKNKVSGLSKVAAALGAMLVGTKQAAMQAHANSVSIVQQSGSLDTLMGAFIGFVLDVAMYVGVCVLVFGVYTFYLAFTESNPDGKIKGVTFVIAGIGLTTIKMVLVQMGVIS